MSRILSIDYGMKRTGLATTDPLQLIVNPLAAVETRNLESFLENYLSREEVRKIVIGRPLHKDGTANIIFRKIQKLKTNLSKQYPELELVYHDEAFSSVKAKEILIQSGMRKKKRAEKGILDMLSAVVILQEYLGHI